MDENRLAVIDGETLADMRLPPTRFFVQTLLPKGVTVLGGAPKVGKSCVTCDPCVPAEGCGDGDFSPSGLDPQIYADTQPPRSGGSWRVAESQHRICLDAGPCPSPAKRSFAGRCPTPHVGAKSTPLETRGQAAHSSTAFPCAASPNETRSTGLSFGIDGSTEGAR